MLDIDDLKAIVNYDPATGLLSWKFQSRNGRRAMGHDATRNGKKGYRVISLNGRTHLAHRVCWLMFYGVPPSGALDHIDGDKTNNAIGNLREASALENSHNIFKPYSTNSSGLLGVYFDKDKNRWRGEIIANKKRHRLGWFKTKEEAHAAYLGAKSLLHKSATLVSGHKTDMTIDDLCEGTPSLGGWRRKSNGN